jgi:hypothetical protein
VVRFVTYMERVGCRAAGSCRKAWGGYDGVKVALGAAADWMTAVEHMLMQHE